MAAAVYACSGLLSEAPRLPVVTGAAPVGSEACADCHDGIAEGFAGLAHRTMAARGDACETCHGAGGTHVESAATEDILGAEVLRNLSAGQKSQMCLQCHTRDVAHFWSSDHAHAGISCWDCHADALHGGASEDAERGDPAAAWGTIQPIDLHRGRVTSLSQPWPGSSGAEFCYQCHPAVKSDFLLQYHHPVPEGRMECGDCHAVHGDAAPEFADAGSDRCLSCHREIAGPWVFEHLAMDDGCLPCHTAHGSTVDKLLLQADNSMCEQCHFDARYPLIGAVDHTRLLSGGALCISCHFQVHGSNTDENLNPLRIEETLRGPRVR
jgi:predicted CXXCH cytochrome family protein